MQVTSEDSIDAVWQGLMLLQIGRAGGLAWRFYGGSAAGDACMYIRLCVCVYVYVCVCMCVTHVRIFAYIYAYMSYS